MTQSTIAVPRFVRVTVIAAMIVATSGMLEGAGLPIFSAIGGIVQNFAAAQSEAKKLRDKAAACLRYETRGQLRQLRADAEGGLMVVLGPQKKADGVHFRTAIEV